MKKLVWLSLMSGSVFAACTLEDAKQLRREIEITNNPIAPFIQVNPITEDFKLKVTPIFPQGNTNYCWAYAGLHAIRTYYAHVPGADFQWRNFLTSFDTTTKYKNWVYQQMSGKNEGGWSIEAVLFFEKNIKVKPPERWVSFAPSTTKTGWHPHGDPDLHSYTPQSYNVKPEVIVEKIRDGLMRGAPIAFCTYTHCTAIYGGNYSGSTPTQYLIADSASGTAYNASPTGVHEKLLDIVAIW